MDKIRRLFGFDRGYLGNPLSCGPCLGEILDTCLDRDRGKQNIVKKQNRKRASMLILSDCLQDFPLWMCECYCCIACLNKDVSLWHPVAIYIHIVTNSFDLLLLTKQFIAYNSSSFLSVRTWNVFTIKMHHFVIFSLWFARKSFPMVLSWMAQHWTMNGLAYQAT